MELWDRGFGVFHVSRLTDFYNDAILSHQIELVKSKSVQYFNIPAAFDIETSSWEFNGQQYATMYVWQFGLNGSVIWGRTWDEFGQLLSFLHEHLGLSSTRHLLVYVHNLGYEFQFMRKYFDWAKVFAIKRRRPVYAISGGFEFRCSLFLSNYALAYIGDNLLLKYPVRKLVGYLDYSKVRHSLTPLTAPELAYCINDVKVVMSYIQEKIEQDGDISKIPLTNTGYVRNYCRSECFFEGATSESERKSIRLNYHAIMKALTVDSEDEYNQLKRAFMGGFTHASVLAVNSVQHDVGSADLTSSYPYAMCGQYFPCTRFKYIGEVSDYSLLVQYLKKYCCIFDVQFDGLLPRVEFENPISLSRCWDIKDYKVNNGRVVSASTLRTTLTELDFETISKFYSWSSMRVVNLRIAHRGFLPKALILSVLKLYENKTALKGIVGKEIEYLVSKNMINAAFGMMVTAIVRGEYAYDNEKGWELFAADVEKQLSSYNKNFNRFLYYGWGVYVTAHARHNLFSAIYEFGADYLYSDTDSIKGINFNDHLRYFEDYNNKVFANLLKMCTTYGIPFSMVRPKNIAGERKLLGVWEIEEGYKSFKSAGAKRYCYIDRNGVFNIVCAGLNKRFAVPYMLYKWAGGSSSTNESLSAAYSQSHNIPHKSDESYFIEVAREAYKSYSDNCAQHKISDAMRFICSLNLHLTSLFPYFGDGLIIPEGHTGKQTLTYIDNEFTAICTDYMGVPIQIHELSAIHMAPQSYLMSQTSDYLKFLAGYREETI